MIFDAGQATFCRMPTLFWPQALQANSIFSWREARSSICRLVTGTGRHGAAGAAAQY